MNRDKTDDPTTIKRRIEAAKLADTLAGELNQ